MIRNKLFSNFNTDDNPDNYVEDMSKTNRKNIISVVFVLHMTLPLII